MNKTLIPNMPGARLPRTIWYTRCPVPTASGIAIQKGWLKEAFASEGIAVRSMRHSHDPKTRESHYTHTLEDSFRQGGNTPALFARSEGKDTVLLGLHWIPQYQAILSLPGSGLTKLKQLKRAPNSPSRVASTTRSISGAPPRCRDIKTRYGLRASICPTSSWSTCRSS